MSIENQATFLFNNVCDYEPNIPSDLALTESLKDGFAEFSNLLKTIYKDYHSYEISTVPSEPTKIGIMTDDLENYHNLTDTVDCLYGMAKVGKICLKDEKQYLIVDKKQLKTEFKKSMTFPLKMLETYCFHMKYYKNDKIVDDYKRCDHFELYYENGYSIFEAMTFIASRLKEIPRNKHMPDKVAFMLADYYFVLTEQINQDPLQNSNLQTLGERKQIYMDMISQILESDKYTVNVSLQPYVFPNRMVKIKQGKKTVCTFYIQVDRISVRLPLTFETAKQLVTKRHELPDRICGAVERFGCVNCGKCQNQSNIVMVDNIPVCTLPYSNFCTEDSRCLLLELVSADECDVIISILKYS